MRLKRILLPALCLIGIGLAVAAVQAQFGLEQAAPESLKGNKDLLGTIGRLIKTVLSYLGVLFLVLMLYAGFLYMTAAGDDKKVGTAKNIIKGAVTGLVIIAASYAIVSFILGAITGSGAPAPAESPPAGKVGKPTGALCSTGGECTSGTCQPALCERNGTSCSEDSDCPDAATGEVCSRRCQ